MLTQYIESAMASARFEVMEDGRHFGSIPACEGAWGEGANEAECREQLRGALEGWILLGLQMGDALPVIEGIDLNRNEPAHARTD